MANTTIEELLNLAYEVRDADQEHENTALRVGGLFEEIIQYLSTVVDLDTLPAILEQFARVNGAGVIEWRSSRIVCLASMGYDLDNIDGGNWNYTNRNGDIVFSPDNVSGYLNVVGTTDIYSVLANVVYVNNHTGHAYLWKENKMVEIRDSATTTIITYLSAPIFSQVAIGESYYYTSGNVRKIAIKISATEVYSFDPDPKKIYVFLDTRQAMIWDSGNRQWISVGGSLIQLVNDLTTGGGDVALSAEMGKRLKAKVDEVQANIQRLYNNLGNIAFWDAAAKSNAAPVPIDWGNPKHTVTLALSLTNAVVKHNGVAVADGGTILVEEGSTLTLIVEPANIGCVLTSVTSSTAGATVTDLGDGTYSVSIVVGGSNVTLDIEVETAPDYVTDGLVAYFDGLDKGSTANAWTDKIGGKVFTNDGATSIAKGWSFNGVGGLKNNDTLNWPASGYTIEVCYKVSAESTTRALFHQKTAEGIGLGLFPHSGIDSITIYCTSSDTGKAAYYHNAATSAFLGTFSANVDRLLANGQSATRYTGSTLGQGISNTIGGRYDQSGGSAAWRGVITGEIYAIRIYSRKLSEAEMLHNLNVDNVVYELGLTLNT